MKIYIHKHPSGGFIANFPIEVSDQESEAIKKIKPWRVWENKSVIPDTIEWEFLALNMTIDQFADWLRWSLNPFLYGSEAVRIEFA